ncbi:MAG: nickel-dependent lactate racemase [Desulfobacteraceae bacterium]|nr:nickel-dependent lactate racemase [Desulfobacteraceae bacterium]
MEISLPWGNDFIRLELPDSWHVHLPERVDISAMAKQQETDPVAEALQNPEKASPLQSMDLSGKNILIIIDDNTRPTPAAAFFHLILEALETAGAEPGKIHVMPALGIHTPMSEKEMAEKIGPENIKKVSWSNHDAFDPSSHHDFGFTSRNTPVILNKKVYESDLVILVGMIEPHLWAGFGGGMKNLFPGVASAEAIGRHHGMIAEPPYQFNRVGMMPEENTFRLDLEETKNLIKAGILVLNVLLDEKHRIAAAFAGDPVATHRKGVEFNKKAAGIRLNQPVDAVIVNSHPMDINFKQSMKCVGNSLPALKPGGVIMAFMRAQRGLDDIPLPDKPPPLPVLRAILKIIGKSNVMGFLNLVKKGLNVEERFLTYYSMRLIREYRLFFYVPTLSETEIRHLGFFQACGKSREVIEKGGRFLKKNAEVAVFPDGGATYPDMTSAQAG